MSKATEISRYFSTSDVEYCARPKVAVVVTLFGVVTSQGTCVSPGREKYPIRTIKSSIIVVVVLIFQP